MEESSTRNTEQYSSQMHLVDLRETIRRAESLDDVLSETRDMWKSIYRRMDEDSTLWVISSNDYREGSFWPVALAIADYARDVSDLVLKNTISFHTWNDRGGDMESAYDEVLFFVKNKREYQFNKDHIRTDHVYQGHEWGEEREEGKSAYHDTDTRRYNPDGKDPGNVWLKEDRTQTNDQTVDKTSEISIQEAIRRCVLAGSKEGETVHVVGGDEFIEIIVEENRVAKSTTLQQVIEGESIDV